MTWNNFKRAAREDRARAKVFADVDFDRILDAETVRAMTRRNGGTHSCSSHGFVQRCMSPFCRICFLRARKVLSAYIRKL
jgi:hypothetical protein